MASIKFCTVKSFGASELDVDLSLSRLYLIAMNCFKRIFNSVYRHSSVPLLLSFCLLMPSALAEDDQVFRASEAQEFSAKYSALTKKILLASVDLERFSLNYRLEHCKQSTVNKLVFFGTQEAGASCGLGFELVADQQFGRARRRVLDLNTRQLGRGLRAAELGSIIAASGCAYELGANAIAHLRSRRRGYDSRAADRFVSSKLREIDDLLKEREALVEANQAQPAYSRAIIEGKILRAMRGSFVNEYAHFSADSRSAAAVQNLFFLLNGAYNTVGAIAAEYGYKSLREPKFNGTSNVLFTVSGSLAAVTPLICSAELWMHRKLSLQHQLKSLSGSDNYLTVISENLKLLQNSTDAPASLIPSLPSTQRFALYAESDQFFTKQLQSELRTMQSLNKVALQNSLIGPAIGGLLMTQGILGSRAYYRYFPSRPRKQFDLDYRGSVCGTVGTSMAVLGNAAWFLASMSYEHRLEKQKRLPEQLIKQRLEHLLEVEHVINSI